MTNHGDASEKSAAYPSHDLARTNNSSHFRADRSKVNIYVYDRGEENEKKEHEINKERLMAYTTCPPVVVVGLKKTNCSKNTLEKGWRTGARTMALDDGARFVIAARVATLRNTESLTNHNTNNYIFTSFFSLFKRYIWDSCWHLTNFVGVLFIQTKTRRRFFISIISRRRFIWIR